MPTPALAVTQPDAPKGTDLVMPDPLDFPSQPQATAETPAPAMTPAEPSADMPLPTPPKPILPEVAPGEIFVDDKGNVIQG